MYNLLSGVLFDTFMLFILKQCRSLITGFHAKCQPVWIFTWEWRGHPAEAVMTNERGAWLVACLWNVPGVCSRLGCMKSSVWPWDGWLKPELLPPHLNVRHLKKSKLLPSAPSCWRLLSSSSCHFSLSSMSYKMWMNSTLVSSLVSSPHHHTHTHTHTLGHWTLNSFLVWLLSECKHNQSRHKNKSVISRDSLCQHFSCWPP